MYSGEYDACDVTLSVYPHRASLKICLTTVGIEPTTFEIPAQCSAMQLSYAVWSVRVCDMLAEHWAGIPKVVGSIPTVVRHIFQACPVWIYTQSNITSINLSTVQKAYILINKQIFFSEL